VSEDDVVKRRFAVAAAGRALERWEAELAEVEAGAWAPDLQVAEAELGLAQADLGRSETELDRLTVRAPAAATVLQLNIRPGEFAQAGPAGAAGPLVLLGDTSVLHVRVDIDEGDAPLFRPGAKAVASVKGRPDIRVPLAFVRVDPFVVPKRSLTGLASERVDTRVLQVIYAIEGTPPVPLYVGQQVDAFIEAAEAPAEGKSAARSP
jgi:multidrug resistance efflux pump